MTFNRFLKIQELSMEKKLPFSEIIYFGTYVSMLPR